MKLVSSIDALAAGLPDSDPRKAAFRSRAATLGQECACAMSGFFLIGAAALAIGYFVAFGQPSLTSVPIAVGLVLATPMLGKLIGLAVVRLRLLTLRREVKRRLSEQEVCDVHLH